jgi:hypothetical protein
LVDAVVGLCPILEMTTCSARLLEAVEAATRPAAPVGLSPAAPAGLS